MGGDELALGDDQLDLVLEVGEGGEEVFDRLALTGAAARLAVVDEVDAEQPLAGAGVAFDDRFAVEAADQLLVLPPSPSPPTVIDPPPAAGDTVPAWVASSSSSPSSRRAWRCSRCCSSRDLLSRAFDSWFVPFLGFFLLPWTTLAYAVMWSSSDRVDGFEWFIVILAFVIDLGSYASRDRARRASA